VAVITDHAPLSVHGGDAVIFSAINHHGLSGNFMDGIVQLSSLFRFEMSLFF